MFAGRLLCESPRFPGSEDIASESLSLPANLSWSGADQPEASAEGEVQLEVDGGCGDEVDQVNGGCEDEDDQVDGGCGVEDDQDNGDCGEDHWCVDEGV